MLQNLPTCPDYANLKIELETLLKIGIQPFIEIAFWKRESISLNWLVRHNQAEKYVRYASIMTVLKCPK